MLAASALCLSSCGNYALYKLHVRASFQSADKSPTSDIAYCYVTITEENQALPVLDHYPFPNDSTAYGCKSGSTQQEIGIFSYSTARTSSKFMFQVDGYNANKDKILQTGQTDLIAAQAYPPEMPEIELLIK
jgi:hypothetical protein